MCRSVLPWLRSPYRPLTTALWNAPSGFVLTIIDLLFDIVWHCGSPFIGSHSNGQYLRGWYSSWQKVRGMRRQLESSREFLGWIHNKSYSVLVGASTNFGLPSISESTSFSRLLLRFALICQTTRTATTFQGMVSTANSVRGCFYFPLAIALVSHLSRSYWFRMVYASWWS